MAPRLATALLKWYATHGRKLPWRRTRNPYRVWVAEIMLQQTQVGTVIPYYRRWLRRFPSVRALAAAPQSEVLALWEGLGYYSRARNLHRAARQVTSEHGGRLPRTRDGLRALPGIGPYTAAAIASIAFGEDAAVLDGNVRRVLARVFDFREDVRSPSGERKLWALAERLVPRGQAGDYNQALMDLGATVCTPRAPACGVCPLRGMCRARRLGVQLERPVARQRAPVPHRALAAGIVRRKGRVLIVQRPAEGLLGGLWAFPAGERKGRASLADSLYRAVRAELGMEIRIGPRAQILSHAFTHFRVTQHVFECRWLRPTPRRRTEGERQEGAGRWVRGPDLGRYPMGKLDRQIAAHLRENSVK
jgi:A/G-specific adenine glycosylase